MATQTTGNLKLSKPDGTDKVKEFRAPYNSNLDKIDEAVSAQSQQIGSVALPTIAQTLTGAISEDHTRITTLGSNYPITGYGYGEHVTNYNGATPSINKNNNIVSIYAVLSTDITLPLYSQIFTGLPKPKTASMGFGKDKDNNLFLIDVEGNGLLVTQKSIPQGIFTVSIMYIKEVNS